MTRRIHLTPGAWWTRRQTIRIRSDRRTLAELEEAFRHAARVAYPGPVPTGESGVSKSPDGTR